MSLMENSHRFIMVLVFAHLSLMGFLEGRYFSRTGIVAYLLICFFFMMAIVIAKSICDDILELKNMSLKKLIFELFKSPLLYSSLVLVIIQVVHTRYYRINYYYCYILSTLVICSYMEEKFIKRLNAVVKGD